MNSNERFEKNISLVAFVFHKHFKFYNDYYEDIIQEGYIALWKACLNYDEMRGYKFSSYACKAIFRRMQEYIKHNVYKHKNIISIETVIAEDIEGNNLNFNDILGNNDDDLSVYTIVHDCIKSLSEFEQQIIVRLLAGKTQILTAKELKTSQASVNRCLSKYRTILKKELDKGK